METLVSGSMVRLVQRAWCTRVELLRTVRQSYIATVAVTRFPASCIAINSSVQTIYSVTEDEQRIFDVPRQKSLNISKPLTKITKSLPSTRYLIDSLSSNYLTYETAFTQRIAIRRERARWSETFENSYHFPTDKSSQKVMAAVQFIYSALGIILDVWEGVSRKCDAEGRRA